jgi:hypothetical protein
MIFFTQRHDLLRWWHDLLRWWHDLLRWWHDLLRWWHKGTEEKKPLFSISPCLCVKKIIHCFVTVSLNLIKNTAALRDDRELRFDVQGNVEKFQRNYIDNRTVL